MAAEPPPHRPVRARWLHLWTPAAAAVAVVVTVVVTGLVWHSTRLPGAGRVGPAPAGAHSGERQFRLATGVATGLRALPSSVGSWPRPSSRGSPCGGWNAVALAVLAPAATLALDKLLKPLVARRAPASTVFHYPSGHVAVATALALSLLLILWPAMTRPRVKALAGGCARRCCSCR